MHRPLSKHRICESAGEDVGKIPVLTPLLSKMSEQFFLCFTALVESSLASEGSLLGLCFYDLSKCSKSFILR